MQFAVFYHANLAGVLCPIMGSDSYCPIDGRYSLERASDEARLQIKRLEKVKPWIIGYEIRKGSIGNSRKVGGIYAAPGKRAEFEAAKAKGILSW